MTTPSCNTMNESPSDAPVPFTHLSAVDFLARAHATRGLDAWIDEQLAQPDVTERSMLRVCVFLLHTIGHSVPWDDEAGLDAHFADLGRREIPPTWRACIGAVLGVEFSAGGGSDDQ